VDQGSIAAVLGKMDFEVFVLTAADGDRRNGQIVCWVVPATLVPQAPRLVVGVGKMTDTREVVEASRKFALNMLAEDQWPWVPHFGFRSGRDVDKFAMVPFERGMTGSPLLPGIAGYLECHVRLVLDAGPCRFYLADGMDGKLVSDRDPLRFHQLFEMLPPQHIETMTRRREQDIARDLSLL